MSYIISFLAGALAGGIAVWIYRAKIGAKLAEAAKDDEKPQP